MNFNSKSLRKLLWLAFGFVCAIGLFQLTDSFSPLQAWNTASATTQVLISNAVIPQTENVSFSEFSQSHLQANYYQHS